MHTIHTRAKPRPFQLPCIPFTHVQAVFPFFKWLIERLRRGQASSSQNLINNGTSSPPSYGTSSPPFYGTA